MRFAMIVVVLFAATECLAEPRIGFDVIQIGEAVVVSHAYLCGMNRLDGVSKGDRVLAVAGRPVKKTSDIAAAVKTKAVGEKVSVRIARAGDRLSRDVLMIDDDQVRKEVEELEAAKLRANEAIEEQARAAAAAKAEERARILRIAADAGPLVFVGRIVDNSLGQPEILILCENISDATIEAARFRVAMFDKFGDPAKSAFGASHEQVFLYQKRIMPGQELTLELHIPWHSTAGKATIVATDFVLEGDRRFVPPRPKSVEVRQH